MCTQVCREPGKVTASWVTHPVQSTVPNKKNSGVAIDKHCISHMSQDREGSQICIVYYVSLLLQTGYRLGTNQNEPESPWA